VKGFALRTSLREIIADEAVGFDHSGSVGMLSANSLFSAACLKTLISSAHIRQSFFLISSTHW
jgi:hypothetical protein